MSSTPGERAALESIAPVTHVPSRQNALGNNIFTNDAGAVVHPEFSDVALERIQRALRVPVPTRTIAGLGTVGMAGIATNRGAVVHPRATEHETARRARPAAGSRASVDREFRVPIVGACLVANSRAFIVGRPTTQWRSSICRRACKSSIEGGWTELRFRAFASRSESHTRRCGWRVSCASLACGYRPRTPRIREFEHLQFVVGVVSREIVGIMADQIDRDPLDVGFSDVAHARGPTQVPLITVPPNGVTKSLRAMSPRSEVGHSPARNLFPGAEFRVRCLATTLESLRQKQIHRILSNRASAIRSPSLEAPPRGGRGTPGPEDGGDRSGRVGDRAFAHDIVGDEQGSHAREAKRGLEIARIPRLFRDE